MKLCNRKYLLYIDILGFAELAKADTVTVRAIFDVLNDINAHRNDEYEVIAFSDTILIYNKEASFDREDNQVTVMFLIEFVKDLFYRLADTGINFRAVLVEGEFEVKRMKNMTSFFGSALIEAYDAEKGLPIIGLLSAPEVRTSNAIFPALNYGTLDYVFVNQALYLVESGTFGDLPIDENELDDADLLGFLTSDFCFLKRTKELLSHESESVQLKAENTLNLYRQMFPNCMLALEEAGWQHGSWTSGPLWDRMMSRVSEGYRGKGETSKSVEFLREVVSEGIRKGRQNARKKYRKLLKEKGDQHHFPAGKAELILNIAPDTKIGQLLMDTNCEKWEFIEFRECLKLVYSSRSSSQNKDIDKVCRETTLSYLEKTLNINGFVETFID